MEAFVQGFLVLQRAQPERYEQLRRLTFETLAKIPDAKSGLELSILLSLHDTEAWLEYFDAFSRQGTADPALKDSLVPVLLAMPKKLRDLLYSKIPSRYGDAMNKKYDLSLARSGPRKGLSAKRAIDAFVRHTVDAPSFFEGATDHNSVKQSYENYMSFKRDVLFAGTEFCQYNAADVMSLLLSLQGLMTPYWQRHTKPAGFASNSNGQSPNLLLMGSFVNCHAQLSQDTSENAAHAKDHDPDYSKSDIDLYVTPEAMIPSLTKFEGQLYSALVSPMAQKFKKTPGLKARLQMHPYMPVESLDASTLSPVFLKLRQRDLLVYLYPPVRFSDLPDDRSLRDLPQDLKDRLGTPRCLALHGSC
jgi:hypothetical protein